MNLFISGVMTGFYLLRFTKVHLPNRSFFARSKLKCATRCLYDTTCVAFFYNSAAAKCYPHDKVGKIMSPRSPITGTVYYVNEGKANALCRRAPYSKLGPYCVTIKKKHQTWKRASQNCRKQGGHLLRIYTAKKEHYFSDIVRDIVNKNLFAFPPFNKVGSNAMWLDGRDVRDEGTWRWTDGTFVNYTAWHTDEPDGGAQQNCLAILKWKQWIAWSSISCSVAMKYFCELS